MPTAPRTDRFGREHSPAIVPAIAYRAVVLRDEAQAVKFRTAISLMLVNDFLELTRGLD